MPPRKQTNDKSTEAEPVGEASENGNAPSNLDGPSLAAQDWDAVQAGLVEPRSVRVNGDIRYGDEPPESLEEEDDNSYQESDEALPEDREERSIARRLSR